MTDIIVTFKMKDEVDVGEDNEDINDYLRSIAEKEEMELISWGTI